MTLRMWILIGLTTAIVGSSSMVVTARPNQRSMQVVEVAIQKFEQMDMQGFEKILAPNARFDNVFALPNTPGTFQGRGAIIANLREISRRFERIEFTDERLYPVQDGRTVIVEARGNFALRGTGIPYRNTYVFVFEVDQEQITAIREYNNPLTVAETFNIPLCSPPKSPMQ